MFFRMKENMEKLTEKQIQDLFFEFAYCEKCHMKANYCKCKIGEPMMMFAQFKWAIQSLN